MTTNMGDGDFGAILSQVQQLQERLSGATSATTIEGTAGGGAVSITVSGEFEFSAVHIDPAVIDPSSADVLEDLLLAALRDAAQKVQDARNTAVGDAMSSALSGLLGTSTEPPEATS